MIEAGATRIGASASIAIVSGRPACTAPRSISALSAPST
ncbi:MAG: hypothetical protein ACK52M_12815, partial [bacterium]